MLRVQKLEINNFRGIEHLVIDFHEQINIFIGDNGCGKSSTLDCLAVMLSRLIGRIRFSEGTGRFFTEQDIHNEKSETRNSLSVDFHDKIVEWIVTKARKGKKKRSCQTGQHFQTETH
ncbi:MAG TPA: hypothetical protein DCQ37_00185 [Desulfobacteraceae bacterium]|nr:hypothetical protein [Desulfobacteraceae bacterium]